MELGFKEFFKDGEPTYFKEKIKRNEKIHSVRIDKNKRWKAERKIDMTYNSRTPLRNCFDNTKKCISVQEIVIDISIGKTTTEGVPVTYKIKVDGRKLNGAETQELIKNDGLTDWEFICWFGKGKFEGRIIHWTDKRY